MTVYGFVATTTFALVCVISPMSKKKLKELFEALFSFLLQPVQIQWDNPPHSNHMCLFSLVDNQ